MPEPPTWHSPYGSPAGSPKVLTVLYVNRHRRQPPSGSTGRQCANSFPPPPPWYKSDREFFPAAHRSEAAAAPGRKALWSCRFPPKLLPTPSAPDLPPAVVVPSPARPFVFVLRQYRQSSKGLTPHFPLPTTRAPWPDVHNPNISAPV